jgi:hypothetical protein
MPDKTLSQNSSSPTDGLPGDIVRAVADSTALAVGEQPAILSNLALANQIFSANLAQQNAIINQQVMFQVKLAAVAKCVQVLLAVDVSDPQAIERITDSILEMFERLDAKIEGGLAGGQAPPPEAAGARQGDKATLPHPD